MAKIEILLPAMGEGIIEATINKWFVSEGSSVVEDDALVEVATDKVDSEIPSPATGKLTKILVKEGEIARVGDIIATLEVEIELEPANHEKVEKEVERIRQTIDAIKNDNKEISSFTGEMKSRTSSGKFISPLVKSIALKEGISFSELDKVSGSGMDGRITKEDILTLIKSRKPDPLAIKEEVLNKAQHDSPDHSSSKAYIKKSSFEGDEIIEMDRVRKLIAEHMVMSKRTSPHVTSFIDADVTKLINWRNKIKEEFLTTEGYKLTLTPIFIDATAMALREFPMINISVDGTNIIKKKNINIGMATALPDGNLIVPVIKNADEKSLRGIARAVNDLANRARNNMLKPDEITGGTFTLTNFGSYNNLAGTPIINQPQVAILGTGVAKKMPAVIETPDGDVIAIRHIMILSLTYDHRVIDGALAGKFLQKIKTILENYSPENL
jgi:2-oxoglutarate dehydrogenase E2 component (dihydrolipoamide succinyltransferase)